VQSALLGWLWGLPTAKELRRYGAMALWRYGAMALWRYGATKAVIFQVAPVVPFYCKSETLLWLRSF